MKKRILLSAAVTLGIAAAVMAMNIAGSVDLNKTVEGKSGVLTEEDFKEAKKRSDMLWVLYTMKRTEKIISLSMCGMQATSLLHPKDLMR